MKKQYDIPVLDNGGLWRADCDLRSNNFNRVEELKFRPDSETNATRN